MSHAKKGKPDGVVVKINVIKAGQRYLVRPAHASARSGDTVRWLNFLGRRIELLFPRNHPLAGVPVQEDGSGNLSLVIPGTRRTGAFSYALYSETIDDFCEGESSPKIIIEP